MRPRRILLWLLALPNLITGAWAIVAPANWYEHFPGWAPRLVAAYPPFNEHLATDAGAGLLATGMAAACAAVWPRRDIILASMAAYASFTTPHALFHLLNPAPDNALSRSETMLNNATLAVAAATSIGLLLQAALNTETPNTGALDTETPNTGALNAETRNTGALDTDILNTDVREPT